jgi:hypothetical protein
MSQTGLENAIPQDEMRDPEARKVNESDHAQIRDKMQDKTEADSFPASDPPSSIPNPDWDSFAA